MDQTGPGRTGPDRTGPDRAGPCRAGQVRGLGVTAISQWTQTTSCRPGKFLQEWKKPMVFKIRNLFFGFLVFMVFYGFLFFRFKSIKPKIA